MLRCGNCERVEKASNYARPTEYECEICGKLYRDEDEALACEAQGVQTAKYPAGTKMATLTHKVHFEPIPYGCPQYEDQVYAIGTVEKPFSIDKHGRSRQYSVRFIADNGDKVGYETVWERDAEAAVLLARFMMEHDMVRITEDDTV